MPMIANIPANIEITTGYGFAAIVNGTVVAARSLNIGDARDLGGIDAQAEIAALAGEPAVMAANKAAEAAWAAYEASGFDDEAVDYDAAAVSIRFGMASTGEFTHTFSAVDAKRAGLPKGWQ